MAIVNITKENYEELVLKAPGKVLLDFWAAWCGPCKMIAPVLAEVAAEHEDVTIGKVNVDEQMELAMQFKIVSIPTLILMEGGEEVTKTVGYCPKEEVEELLGL